MRQHQTNKPRGATMLVAVIILSAIMLGFAILGSTIFNQEIHNLTILINKKNAEGAATGCLETAINRLGRNSNYTGNETISLGRNSCTIRPINPGPPWTIESEAVAGNQHAMLRAILSSRSPVVITSWEEVASF